MNLLLSVREIRAKHPKMGVIKLREKLKHHPDLLGRDRFYALLRSHGMLVRTPRSYRRTTNSNHLYRKYPNLLERKKVTRPMQVWVSDITYVEVAGKFQYLSLITDHSSKKVVGAVLAPNLASKHTLRALREAIAQEGKPQMHHSDRGIQYCCHAYVSMLEKNQIAISMTQTGDPLDNAVAERINGILKQEYIYPYLETGVPIKDILNQSLEAYNNDRPHRSLAMKTPEMVHNMSTVSRKKNEL